MKIKYILSSMLVSCHAGFEIKKTLQSTLDYSKDLLSTLSDVIDITPSKIIKSGLQTGFQIHTSITGHNPLYDLTLLEAKDFTPADGTSQPQQSLIDAYNENIVTSATVRASTALSAQEKAFVEKRLFIARNSFQQLCNQYGIAFSNSKVPHVALCASGGGCRAMIATLAFYQALEDIAVRDANNNSKGSLLDVALYAAALSGSTWTTIPRALGISNERLLETYKKYIQFTPENLGLKKPKSTSDPISLTPEIKQGNTLAVDANASLSSSISAKDFKNLPSKLSATKSDYLIPQTTPNDHNLYNERSFIYDNILRSFYGDIPLSGMDIYGIVLSHMIGAAFDDPLIDTSDTINASSNYYSQPRQRLFYSQASTYLESNNCGTFPLPLASAIAPKQTPKSWLEQLKGIFSSADLIDDFQWFEFSPYEIGTVYQIKNKNYGAFVPTWAFGRKYKKVDKTRNKEVFTTKERSIANQAQGSHSHNVVTEKIRVRTMETIVASSSLVSQKAGTYNGADFYVSEYPLGNLLGIFGSAFAFSPADYLRITGMTDSLPNYPYLTTLMTNCMNNFKFTSLIKNKYNNFRLFPFTTNNFMKLVDNTPCPNDELVLVDAGLDFNLPFPLLLRQERQINVIIAMDASSPVYTVDSKGNKVIDALVGAEKWAQKHNIPFPKIVGTREYATIVSPDKNGRTSQNIFIFKGNDEAPTLIYIPLLDNPANKDSQFKVADCMKSECNTFNFGYSEDTVQSLYDHVYNTINNQETIKKILQAIASAQ